MHSTHSYHWGWFVVFLVVPSLLFLHVEAQEGALVRTVAKEVVESLTVQAEKQGTRAVLRELAEFGGEAAARDVFEVVARASGEQGLQRIAQLSKTYGLDALRAAKAAPGITARFMEQVAPDLAPGALRALAREGETAVWSRIDQALVPAALEAAARHPGVGAPVVEKLGAAGALAATRYDTDLLIQLARSPAVETMATLPAAERKGLIAALVDFLEQHPKVVLTGTAVGLFVQYKKQLLGGDGAIVTGPDGTPVYVPATGIIERQLTKVTLWLLPLMASLLGLWGANRLFWAWKWSKLSYETQEARLARAKQQRGGVSNTAIEENN
jgi:hypothetical protein